MGALGGMLGLKGGANGTGFSTPQATQIDENGANGQTAMDSTNAALQSSGNAVNTAQQQQALLSALQQQNALQGQTQATANQASLAGQLGRNGGVGNQTAQYQQASGLENQLAAQNGAANQSAALQGINNTANQYQNIANGTGPNPAQAMLNQQTGANVANQAALMAGQRGAASNVGLMARQAAQQGAATQQQAVGQGATMQANQSLNALSGLANAQQAAAGISAQQIAQQQQQQNLASGQAQQQIANQMGANQALSGQTNALAGQQIGQTNQNLQSSQAQQNLQQQEQNLQQQAVNSRNQAKVALQGNINSGNTALAQAGMQQQSGMIGGLLNGAGAALGAVGARGGVVKKPRMMAEGGVPEDSSIEVPSVAVPPTQKNGSQSKFAQFLSGTGEGFGGSDPLSSPLQSGMGNFGKGLGSAISNMRKPAPAAGIATVGPDAPAATMPTMMDSPTTMVSARGGQAHHDYRSGGNVKAKNPKEKAVKEGNSYANDKIPAVLSEGEVVIPRSVMQSKDPIKNSAMFVQKVLMKKRGKK